MCSVTLLFFSIPPSAFSVIKATQWLAPSIIAKFIVEKDGSISNVQVVRSVHPLLDKQAVDVLMRMPKWNPGKHNGQPARIWLLFL